MVSDGPVHVLYMRKERQNTAPSREEHMSAVPLLAFPESAKREVPNLRRSHFVRLASFAAAAKSWLRDFVEGPHNFDGRSDMPFSALESYTGLLRTRDKARRGNGVAHSAKALHMPKGFTAITGYQHRTSGLPAKLGVQKP